MPVVGLAEVLIQPSFRNSQRDIQKQITPVVQKAGKNAGKTMGKSMGDGFADETAGLAAEAERLGGIVSKAQTAVAASKTKMVAASNAEEKALGELRVAELRLSEARANSNAKASQIAAAETRLTNLRNKATQATMARETAESGLTRSTTALGKAETESARASADLDTQMKRVAASVDSTNQSVSRLGVAMRNAFSRSPLAGLANKVRSDSSRISLDLHQMAQNVSQAGTRGGRGFTQGFIVIIGGLTSILPAAGAAGAALLAAAGNALTLGSSLGSLAGLAALLPAGLLSIAAGAGVLSAAFHGVGDAMKAITDAQAAGPIGNPRLQAMAVQDAQMAITVAEENAARSRVDAARRVADAKRSLQATTEQVAQAQIAANRAVEDSERRIAEAQRGVLEAQRALTEAKKADKAAVDQTGRAAFDAKRDETDTGIAYRSAVAEFDKAKAAGVGGDALKQLDNNVHKAYAAYFDAKNAVEDTAAAHRKAEKEAKSGSQATRDAAQVLADARQAQRDAVRDHADAVKAAQQAEEDGARAIADARRGITDAIEAQEQAQVSATRAVEQANRNLERVQLQQADAAEQAGKASKDAMDKLTPAAQTAVKALLSVYDRLGAIRRIAQENFFTGFTAPLLALAGTVLPQLATGVGAIASALGSGVQTLMGSLGTALDGGVLRTLLMGVADSITILNRAIDPLVQAFVTLGVVGMDYMPRLAEAIADVATRFNGFIQTAAADGSLVTWIDAGIQALKDLWSIAGSVVGIFGALTAAAAAGGAVSTLGGLADGLDRIEKAMLGEVFQTTMATIFRGAEQGAQGLLDALGPIGDAFVRGAEGFAEFLRLGGEISGMFIGGIFTALSDPTFGAGLTSFMESLKRGVADMVPLMPGLTAAFGGFLEALGPIVERLGPSLVQVFTAFGTILGTVLSVFQPLLVALAGSPVVLGILIGAFTATAAASAALTAAGNVQRIAMGIWKVATVAWTIATKAATVAIKVFGWAVKKFPGMWIITLIGLVVAGLVWFFTKTKTGQKIVEVAWMHIRAAINVVAQWFQKNVVPMLTVALQKLGRFFTWLWKNAIKPAFQAIGKFIGWTWTNVIKPAFKAIGWFLENILAPVIKWWWNKIVKPYFGFIGKLAKWLWEKAIKPAFKALGWYIENVLGPVMKWLWNKIVKPVFGWIGDKIAKVWKNGIKPAFSALADFIKKTIPNAFDKGVSAVRKAWDKLKDIAKAPVKFVVETVINKGLIRAFNKVAGFLPGVKELDPVKLPKGFAGGGVLPGFQPRKRDDVLMPMRSGEGVLVPEVVKATGAGFVHALNRAGNSGGVQAVRALMARGLARGGLVRPIPGAPITSGYGRGGSDPSHDGIDFGAPYGTAVRAAGGGRVTAAGWHAYGGGNHVAVNHGNGLQTEYYHLSKILTRLGEMVRGGSTIGRVGSTGNSTGPHLHYEVHRNNSLNGVDPTPYLDGGGRTGAGGGFNPLGALTGLISRMAGRFSDAFPGGGRFADMAMGTGRKLIGDVTGWVKDKVGSLGDNIRDVVGKVAGGAKMTGWATQALAHTGDLDPFNLTSMIRRMDQESGGNPRAVNNWDVNARNGNASRGLMQVIPTTFSAYRDRKLPNDIFDPLANMVAAIRYTKARYGDLTDGWNRPGGYATGTGSAAPGWSWVGERGPELLRFRGGEQVKTHGESMRFAERLGASGGVTLPKSVVLRVGDREFDAYVDTRAVAATGGALNAADSRIRFGGRYVGASL